MPLTLSTPPSRLQVAALAGAFTDILDDWLGPARFAAMREANRAHRGTTTCASHDHCDANMAMLEAFQTTFGQDPRLEDQPDGGEGLDIGLWNAAWALASTTWLTAPGRSSVPAFHHTLMVKLSDHHGDSITSLAELIEDLSSSASPLILGELEAALLGRGTFQGGYGAEPVWTVTLVQSASDAPR